MTIVISSCKLCKIIAILSILLSAASKHRDTLESVSVESKEDSGGVEDRYSYDSDRMSLDLTGKLRQTMVYHMGLMDTRASSVCSPLSALLPLGKLAMGSSSRRYKELRDATGYRRSKVVRRFTSVMSHLQQISGKVQLTIASRLYVSNKHSMRSQFHDRVRHVFKSSCERVDFNDPAATARSINRWINTETKGLITNLIKPGEIDRSTSLIITNVIYFNGRWRKKFDDVSEGVFTTPSREIIVKLMSRVGTFKYVKSDRLDCEIVEIPYSGKDVSFVAVLPTAKQGLPSLLRNLIGSPKRLNDVMSQMKEKRMSVQIPRFKITSNLDLSAIYFKIGLKDIFKRDNKILTKVLKGTNVHVSKAVHAAVIEVDEYGTEGAGTSAVQMVPISAVYVDTTFRADHPFLFYVVANGEQLFGGIYTGD